ncbi:hypothetical protein [Agathobacter sp.]|uniref:hypothetical protein n=1 Tax=Agathobacter sp. TaxID=2021311 RepID=UPI003AB13185
MIILAKEYTDFIKRIRKTINNMGKSCSVCTLMPNTDHDADDVFGFYDRYINDENIKSAHTKELYYAFIKLPEWWAVCADGINGAVYDNDVKKASIYFNEPIEKRNVRSVEWHDEENRVYRKDHYNKMGYKYCTENLRSNKIIQREFYDSEGNLVVLEQVMSGTYTVFEKNNIKKVYTSFAELFKDIMTKAEISDKNIVVFDVEELEKIYGLREEYSVTFYLNDDKQYEKFQKGEFKDKLRILCNDKNKSDWIAQHTDCVCKNFSLYDKREKNKSGIKKALIFTDSDQLEMIETLITRIPDLEFYIAAWTLMSDKLLQLQDYENVYLYPVVSEEKIKELFDLCDIYLDINHYNEVYDSTNLAVNNSMAVFAFENTVHRRDICLKKNIFETTDCDKMIGRIKETMFEESIYQDLIKEQYKKLYIAAAGMFEE